AYTLETTGEIAGKYHDAPIHELLGTYRTELPAYASTYFGDTNGGLDSPEAFETVQDLTDGDLTAVWGNMDPDLGLPDVEVLDTEGVRLVITHGTGDPASYERRVAAIAREEGGEEAVAIAGHTHQVTDTTVEGTRLLNPGSATGADPAPIATMLTLAVEDSTLEVSHHEK
ncbi:hypothetical protein BRC86_12090, partial [Halobacteriales archaeon QS_3_64_16]